MPLTNLSSYLKTLILGCSLLAIGCGTENSPVSSTPPADEAAPGGRSVFAFSPDAARQAVQAGKANGLIGGLLGGDDDCNGLPVAVAGGRSVCRNMGLIGGELNLTVDGGLDALDHLSVDFTVLPATLGRNYPIRMTVYGETLSELVVDFEPGGLTFAYPATLGLHLGHNRVDVSLDEMRLYHVHDDGTVEDAGVVAAVQVSPLTTHIYLEVPGFSRYGMWRGR